MFQKEKGFSPALKCLTCGHIETKAGTGSCGNCGGDNFDVYVPPVIDFSLARSAPSGPKCVRCGEVRPEHGSHYCPECRVWVNTRRRRGF
jgi:Zn finger protein HypA/HybF involved in hydrogenase expression